MAAVAAARSRVAGLLDAHPDEIVFTGGGTEGDNLAVLGVATGLLDSRKIGQPGHIITSAIEHRAVLDAARRLENSGWRVTYLPVTPEGVVDLVVLREALSPDTVLVSIMYANNEMGAIQPIREIAKILRAWRKQNSTDGNGLSAKEGGRLPYFHTDACQAPRFLPLSVEKLGVDLMTLNGAKVYGPKGSGCLFVRRNTFIGPLSAGGGQERGLRSGTENVPGIAGLAAALQIAQAERERETARLTPMRDRLIAGLRKLGGSINGSMTDRLPNNVNVSFPGLLGELLVLSLNALGIACSAGSACSANHEGDEHVIMALGKDAAEAETAVRFSLGRDTTKADIDRTITAIEEVLKRNRKIRI
jgi:cysteine desulfurase